MNFPLHRKNFDGVKSKEMQSILNQSGNYHSILKIPVDRHIPNTYFVTDQELKQRIHPYQEIINLSRPLMNHYIANFERNIHLTLIDDDGCVLFSLHPNHIGAVCPGFLLINQNASLKDSLRKGSVIELFSEEANENLVCMPIETENSALYLTIANKKGKIPSDNLKCAFCIYKIVTMQYLMTKQFLHVINSLLETNQDHAFIIDEDGFITDANSKCLNLFGIDSNEILKGIHVKDLLSDYGSIYEFNRLHNHNSFKIFAQNKWTTVEIVDKKILYSPSGTKQLLILFQYQNKSGITPITAKENQKDNLITFQDIIATSPKMQQNIELAKKASLLSTTVLIEGESGTGKDLIAQGIHTASDRKGPFVAINCGAIPRELLQSELFGYSDGSFTGAKKGGRRGKIAEAHGGTLFLDEIGEMPKDMQVTLLRFLQNKVIIPLGDNRPQKVDVRIIAATNRNLRQEVEKGSFREDLYYRLNVINIKLPSLKERKEDIPFLVKHILKQICQEYKIPLKSIDTEAIHLLLQYDWPGNVRELHNVLEKAIVISDSEKIEPKDLLIEEFLHKPKSIKEEKEIIIDLLDKYDGNISAVAKELGIARSTLYRRMKNLNVNNK